MPRRREIIRRQIAPDPKYGEPSTWDGLQDFVDAVSDGSIHPLDAKMAVADGLAEILAPVSQHFSQKPELLEAINRLTGSQ